MRVRVVITIISMMMMMMIFGIGEIWGLTTTWCVARSEASIDALQAALDYACGIGGADCTPLQPNGLCFLPNTIQAHSSYAFDSYYHRRSMSPGSCDFSGTATVAQSDPSYGSCVYPSSLSTAGGSSPTTISTNNPTTSTTLPGFGGLTPPTFPDDDDGSSRATLDLKLATIIGFLFISFFIIYS